MKLTTTDGADPNYLATVIKLPTIKEHPNADKLELVEVFGDSIVIGKGSYTQGDKVVYFPVESCLSRKFLSHFNLFDKVDLNADGKTKGYFSTSARVKAIRLREIPSQGFLFKVSDLAKYYEIDENTFSIGDIFDTVGDDTLVTKYVKGSSKGSGDSNVKKSRLPKWVDATIGILPRRIRIFVYKPVNAWFNRGMEGIKAQIVDGHFAYHYKTEHLGKNMFLVKDSDRIVITSKLHGTSAVFGNVLCKRSMNPLRSLWNKLGGNIPTTEHKFVYSSRSVLKNRKDGKYTEDVWGDWAKKLDGEIRYNTIFYGEIVGHTSSGKTIQPNYDYGVLPKESEFRVYRVTYNLGHTTYEMDWDEIESECDRIGLKTVPILYHGYADALFPEIPKDENWNDQFLSVMKDTYLDKDCDLCKGKIVNEGVVLRVDNIGTNPRALKFKSPKFVIKESSARDKGVEDMEEDA